MTGCDCAGKTRDGWDRQADGSIKLLCRCTILYSSSSRLIGTGTSGPLFYESIRSRDTVLSPAQSRLCVSCLSGFVAVSMYQTLMQLQSVIPI